MAALTQPRFDFPYFGRRYGSFAGKTPEPDAGNVPDFMHGTLGIRPYLFGTIVASPHLSGKCNASPHLYGDIRTNP